MYALVRGFSRKQLTLWQGDAASRERAWALLSDITSVTLLCREFPVLGQVASFLWDSVFLVCQMQRLSHGDAVRRAERVYAKHSAQAGTRSRWRHRYSPCVDMSIINCVQLPHRRENHGTALSLQFPVAGTSDPCEEGSLYACFAGHAVISHLSYPQCLAFLLLSIPNKGFGPVPQAIFSTFIRSHSVEGQAQCLCLRVFKNLASDPYDDSVGKRPCHQPWQSEWLFWDPHDGRRKGNNWELSSDLHTRHGLCSPTRVHIFPNE